jgi:hypothetical protein
MLKPLASTTGQSQVQAVDAKEKVSRVVALRLATERGTMIAGEPQPVQA